jgi:hypothetical protein
MLSGNTSITTYPTSASLSDTPGMRSLSRMPSVAPPLEAPSIPTTNGHTLRNGGIRADTAASIAAIAAG